MIRTLAAALFLALPFAPAQAATTDHLVDGVLSATITGGLVASAVAGCGLPASTLGVAPGIVAGAACGTVAAYYAPPPVVSFAHELLIPWRQPDGTATYIGELVGTVAGAGFGVVALRVWWRGSFALYASNVRAITEQTYRRATDSIDPQGLRGFVAGYDLDHIVSVGCGWMLGIPPSLMANSVNLQLLPSSVNRSLGSACR